MKKILTTIGILGLITVGYLGLPEKTIEPVVEPVKISVGAVTNCKTDNARSLNDRIINCPLSGKEKANFKAQEIAKLNSNGIHNSSKFGVKIDIISVEAIEGGIQVFAKAWRGNKQLGFGADGTVEIERFLIYNPPIFVPDPNGEITREWTDEITGELQQRKLREDLTEAVRQVISHNVTLVGKEDTNIIKGKIGNTTSTFFPDADPETSSADGWTRHEVAQTAWSTLVAAAGNQGADSSTSLFVCGASSHATSDWNNISRSFAGFDTASIPDGDAISSATISFYGKSKTDGVGFTPACNVYAGTLASPTAVASTDYASIGSTDFATAITYAAWNTSAYNDYVLNASGVANISKTAISTFGTSFDGDVNDSEPSIGSTNADTLVQAWSADDTTGDPKLVVEHAVAVVEVIEPPEALFIF